MGIIDSTLVDTLLNMSEGDTLDFKRDQYPLSGATDEQKGELVKDILAFANAWKTSDAHIVVGAKANPGARAELVGVKFHLDDADVQQLVNGKTSRPVVFEYIPTTFDGVSLGIFRIAREQERPVYLKKAFGRLKPGVVYIRRGSSTADADPDEVAHIGAARHVAPAMPELQIELAEPERRQRHGNTLCVVSKVLRKRPPAPPELDALRDKVLAINIVERSLARSNAATRGPDPDELAEYHRRKGLLRPAGFWVVNAGTQAVEDLRLIVNVDKATGLELAEELPERPLDRVLGVIAREQRIDPGIFGRKPALEVDEFDDAWEITFRLGKLQPGEEKWSRTFFIGSNARDATLLRMRAFADSLPKPLAMEFRIDITTELGLLPEGSDDRESGDQTEAT